jgi:hypothetical protein
MMERQESARLKRTALDPNECSEWVTITHSFHPLSGQQFGVLKERLVGGVPTVVLRGSSQGTFAVPCEWTSKSDPFEHPIVFDAVKLLQLSELIAETSKRRMQKGG